MSSILSDLIASFMAFAEEAHRASVFGRVCFVLGVLTGCLHSYIWSI